MKPLSGHRLYIMYAVLLFMAFAVLPIHGQVNLNNRFKNLTLQFSRDWRTTRLTPFIKTRKDSCGSERITD